MDKNLQETLVEIYQLEEQGMPRLAHKAGLRLIFNCIYAEDFATMNELLAAIEFEKVSILTSMGLFRATSLYKERLPSWYPRILTLRDFIDASGKDSKRILVGLI